MFENLDEANEYIVNLEKEKNELKTQLENQKTLIDSTTEENKATIDKLNKEIDRLKIKNYNYFEQITNNTSTTTQNNNQVKNSSLSIDELIKNIM